MCGCDDFPICGCDIEISATDAEEMLEGQDEAYFMACLNSDDPIVEDDEFSDLSILSPELVFSDIEERHNG